MINKIAIDELCRIVIGASYEVYNTLGKGFVEAVYRNALAYELSVNGIEYEVEKSLDVIYKNVKIGNFRADIIVDNRLILELKATSETMVVHEIQLVNYLKATGIDHGLLLNFGGDFVVVKHKYRCNKH